MGPQNCTSFTSYRSTILPTFVGIVLRNFFFLKAALPLVVVRNAALHPLWVPPTPTHHSEPLITDMGWDRVWPPYTPLSKLWLKSAVFPPWASLRTSIRPFPSSVPLRSLSALVIELIHSPEQSNYKEFQELQNLKPDVHQGLKIKEDFESDQNQGKNWIRKVE